MNMTKGFTPTETPQERREGIMQDVASELDKAFQETYGENYQDAPMPTEPPQDEELF